MFPFLTSLRAGRLAASLSFAALAACAGEPAATGGTDAIATDGIADFATSGDAGADVSGPSEGSFVALTYNVHGLPASITGDDTGARITAIAPKLAPFDVVGLQESFIAKNQGVIDDANDHAYKAAFGAKVSDEKVYGSGLAWLLRLPVETAANEHYGTCNGLFDAASDCLASKGVMMVRLRLGPDPDCTLDVYDTHFEAGGGSADEAVRTQQVSRVLELFATQSAGRAVLFMGDTNLKPSDPPDRIELDRFAAAGLTDACTAVDCAEPDRIDRFLYRSSDSVTIEAKTWSVAPGFVDGEGNPLSDHDPIRATFAWSCKASK